MDFRNSLNSVPLIRSLRPGCFSHSRGNKGQERIRQVSLPRQEVPKTYPDEDEVQPTLRRVTEGPRVTTTWDTDTRFIGRDSEL